MVTHCVRADLVEACETGGIAVVGPAASIVRRLSDPDGLCKLVGDGRIAEGVPTRRVEVDILADDHGTVWTLGGRDVSVRRDGRSLLAEAPCAAIDSDLARRIRASAADLARRVEYRGAGVVSFVHDGTDFDVSGFDCVAAPDHATTEERTGASVIGWRLRVQRGEPLPAGEPAGEGIVVEARLLAEDPDAGFLVTPGRVALFSFPVGTGVRIDANRRVGDSVDPTDPLLAVVTAWGPDRTVALGRVRRALERTAVVVDGGATNRTLLLSVLGHDDYVSGEIDDTWLERFIADRPALAPSPVALLAAAVEAYETDRGHAQAIFYATAERGRPQQPIEVGAGIELGYHGVNYRLDVDCIGPSRYSVRNGAARRRHHRRRARLFRAPHQVWRAAASARRRADRQWVPGRARRGDARDRTRGRRGSARRMAGAGGERARPAGRHGRGR